jgi:hypothetical protein
MYSWDTNRLRSNEPQGLLDTVSRIESRIDGLKALLNDPESDYKIMDVNFHIVDRDRWLNFVEAFSKSNDRPRLISVRLIRYKDNGPLTLAFAERKLRTHMYTTWFLLVSRLVLDNLKEKVRQLRRKKASREELDRLNHRVNRISDTVDDINRSRSFNRFLLYAARHRVLNPERSQEGQTGKQAPWRTRQAYGACKGGASGVQVCIIPAPHFPCHHRVSLGFTLWNRSSVYRKGCAKML